MIKACVLLDKIFWRIQTFIRFRLKPFAIVVQHQGRMANRMFQYMFACRLRDMIPHAVVYDAEIPEFGIRCPRFYGPRHKLKHIEGLHEFDIHGIVRMALNESLLGIVFIGYAHRLEYYYGPDYYRRMFPLEKNKEQLDDKTLVIHVRAGDLLTERYPYLHPIPFSFYEQIILETGMNPVFIGENVGDHPFYGELRKRFSYARFINHISGLDDFSLLRHAKHIVMSLGSFSWLGSWLSEAITIHLPIVGFFNPYLCPDVQLLPLNDIRYRFYRFRKPLFKDLIWHGTKEDFDVIYQKEPLHKFVSTGELSPCRWKEL